MLSIAATVHVGDLSPHLLTIAFSYLWTLLLLRIELEDRPLTGPTLFGLSALLGAWSLVSATSLFGLATLAIFLIKRRNSPAVVLPVLACYAIPQLQLGGLGHLELGSLPAGTDANIVWQGLQQHWPKLAANPLRYGCYLAVELGNYILNDNPLNVLIQECVGLVVLRHRAKWLLWVCTSWHPRP